MQIVLHGRRRKDNAQNLVYLNTKLALSEKGNVEFNRKRENFNSIRGDKNLEK